MDRHSTNQEVYSRYMADTIGLFECSRKGFAAAKPLSVPKHVTLSEKMRLGLLVSIPLALLMSSMRPRSRYMSLDMLERCQLVPVRIPSLFEQNVLRAVGRTLIEGSCKVYAGKTYEKTN